MCVPCLHTWLGYMNILQELYRDPDLNKKESKERSGVHRAERWHSLGWGLDHAVRRQAPPLG